MIDRAKAGEPLQSVYLDPFKISIDRHGAERYTKISYPVRCGRYGEIKTTDY